MIDALDKGYSVRVVIHYGDCQLEYDEVIQEKSIDATGGMTVDVFEYFEAGSIGNELAFLEASTSKLLKTR